MIKLISILSFSLLTLMACKTSNDGGSESSVMASGQPPLTWGDCKITSSLPFNSQYVFDFIKKADLNIGNPVQLTLIGDRKATAKIGSTVFNDFRRLEGREPQDAMTYYYGQSPLCLETTSGKRCFFLIRQSGGHGSDQSGGGGDFMVYHDPSVNIAGSFDATLGFTYSRYTTSPVVQEKILETANLAKLTCKLGLK